MAKRKGKSKDLVAAKALPTEVWQCIASHASLRTWARTAAPTCKALWNLQLTDVRLEGGAEGYLLSHSHRLFFRSC